MTQKRLEEFLGVPQSGSEFGHQMRSALTGPFPWPAGTVSWSLGGRGTDLEPSATLTCWSPRPAGC